MFGNDEIPNAEVKTKKPFYKRWWFVVLVLIVFLYVIVGVKEASEKNTNIPQNNIVNDGKNIFEGYTLIEVDGGDLSGNRKPNVVVDVGFGDREYYAFTNQYGQLVKVIADVIILQDHSSEPVTDEGRYYPDEAKVPGVESSTLDEGHVIADSLGGVSNAYNITPQNSTLNRDGDQAYMENVIREADGCTDFLAVITYPDTKTQIPDHYSFTYTLNGRVICDEFDNVNPDEVNAPLLKTKAVASSTQTTQETLTIPETTSVRKSSIALEIVRVDLRGEEVEIRNNSNEPIQLQGYCILSVKGEQKYIFPSYIINPGQSVTVYSKGGSGDLKWCDSNIWNNEDDPAQLYNTEGTMIDAY